MSEGTPTPTAAIIPLKVAADPQERLVVLEREVTKLKKINEALISRVERNTDFQGGSYSLFQTAILLEDQVRERTEELSQALHSLEQSNRELSGATEAAETARAQVTEAIESLSEGFVLYDSNDRLVLSNSKFRAFFPQMEDIIGPGLTFKEFTAGVIERGVVAVSKRQHQDWIEQRLRKHRNPGDAITVVLSDGRWLHISERRTTYGGTVGIYTDVSDIKKVEAQRRERELSEKSLQLTATLDNLSQGVSVFDRDNNLAYWNERFISLLGLPPNLAEVGTPFVDILGSGFMRKTFPDTDLIADLVNWSRSTNRLKPLRAEYRRYDGLVVEVQRNAMPDGGFVSTYTDVTDQRRAAKVLEEAKETLEQRVTERTMELTELNDQLREAKAAADKANLSKTKFLAAASHDLLQPLNAARLFVSALMDSDEAADHSRLVDRVDTALGSVDELLQALFDISKLDTGIITPEWRDIAIGDLLESLTDEFALMAENKGISMRLVSCSAVIKSDMLLLRRILLNLLSNAIRYTSAGGVVIGCRRKRHTLCIEVWDSGPGIPEDLQQFIFEEFQRFAPVADGSDSGFGLGLAIAQRSARILGHRLEVQSVPGKGSVFRVEVPYGQTAKVEPVLQGPVLHRNYGLGNATIVFVENDESNLEGMTALLTKWSCHVLPAHNAAEAQALLDRLELHPDLIIADYHLDDDLTGVEAIAEVRAHCGLPLPGVVITADHTDVVGESIKKAGYELLQKPIKPAELRSLISHILA